MMLKSIRLHSIMSLLAISASACLTGSGGGGAAISGSGLTITSPTSASAIDTTDTTISLAGNANSSVGILKVTWANDRGGAGVASGTDSWQIANIALEFGVNRITVTAEDNAGIRTGASIAVFRESGKAGTATLFWTAPTSRTDGSALTNLAGYKIFYGRMSGIYDYQIDIINPGIVAYVVENLSSGDWYFALTAYDTGGNESNRSNEAVRHVK